MTYQDQAQNLTSDDVVKMLRALDAIANTATDIRPGHPEYASKADLVAIAQRTLNALPTVVQDFHYMSAKG